MTKSAIEAQATAPEQIAQIGIDRAERRRTPSPRPRCTSPPSRCKSMAEGDRARPGAARQARQRLHLRRGHGSRQPEDQVRRHGRRQGRRQLVQRQLPRRHLDAPAARRRRLRHAASPTRRATRSSARSATAAPPAPDFSAQLVLGIVTNNNDPEDLGRVRVQYPALSSETEGAWARIATRERRQGARAADAPGRRRGGARRLRARRHHPALRARLAVQRHRHARRRPAARQGRLVRRAERQAHPDAGEGDVHDQGRRGPHDRGRRQGDGDGPARLDPRGAGEDRDQVHRRR